MKKTKIWLLIGASLILAGAIIFVGGMTLLKWNFLKLDISEYNTKIYEIQEEIDNITVTAGTADITILPSDDGEIRVECYESKKQYHTVTFGNGSLRINLVDERKWYDYIQICAFKSPKITIYLPENEYGDLFIKATTGDINISKGFVFDSIEAEVSTGDVKCFADSKGSLKIKTSTGDVYLNEIDAGSCDIRVTTGDIKVTSMNCESEFGIKVTTGDVKLTSIRCGSFNSTGSTGSIVMTDFIASEQISIKRSTGDVKFVDCDAMALEITTDTGDVRGNLLTDKIFICKSDTGSMKYPETTSGGICRVHTDTGDIKLSISN